MEYTEHVHPTESPTTSPDDVCAHLDMGHSMTSMSFHFGYCENVMFDWWKIRDVGTLIGSMIVIFILAAIYELIKHYRAYLWSTKNNCERCPSSKSGSKTGLVSRLKVALSDKMHAVQTLFHVLQVIISYFLMLIFMVYNFWLCLAIVLGAGCGYFCFGWDKKNETAITIVDHCN